MPDQPESDDPWLPGETAPTDGTEFLACTFTGTREICSRQSTSFERYEHVEGDLYRRVLVPHEYWNSNAPALWCPLPALPSQERIEEARRWALLDGRAADTMGQFDHG